MRFNFYRSLALSALFFVVLAASGAAALPFNDDMVNTQLKTGQVARGRDQRTVPVGTLGRNFGPNKDGVLGLVSPVKADKESLASGKRYFDIQCSTCHGWYNEKGDRTPAAGTMPAQGQPNLPGNLVMVAPDLAAPEIAVKPDGHFFQYIHYGGVAIMPVYGYKMSVTEHWDIVNYIRSMQKARNK